MRLMPCGKCGVRQLHVVRRAANVDYHRPQRPESSAVVVKSPDALRQMRSANAVRRVWAIVARKLPESSAVAVASGGGSSSVGGQAATSPVPHSLLHLLLLHGPNS